MADLASIMHPESTDNIITLNVGGQLFQTTPETLALAGPNSLLSTFSASTTTAFIDRDPDLFSILLSFLRTSHLPSKAVGFDLLDVIAEAQFYGIDPRSITDVSNSSRFDGFDLQKSQILPLNGRDSPSAIAATTASGSVHVAHGSKITCFDWSLRRKSTVLTCFPEIDSLVGVSDSLVAAGATDFAGLRVFDVRKGEIKATLDWKSSPLPGVGGKSTVQSIGSSPDHLLGSFESSRRNSNAIVAFDHTTLHPAVEFGRADEIYSTATTTNDLYSAIPATKLQWVPTSNLLMASGSHGGPSGLIGSIKLWDIRSCSSGPIWHLKERDDCFSDVTVSDALSAIFKVGVNSGDVFMMDLRRLTSGGKQDGSQWACIGEAWRSTGAGKGREGSGCKMESYGNQVFCVKGENVEMWSEVAIAGGGGGGGGLGIEDGMVEGRIMRRNVMGRRVRDGGGCGRITKIGFGGNRMFLTRKDQQFVEVWESHVVLKL